MKKGKKIWATAFLGCFFAALVSGCGKKNLSANAEYIGLDAAKEVALKEVGVSKEQASFSSAGLDDQNGIAAYEIKFEENNNEHMYAIDALTGEVLEEKHSKAQQQAGLDQEKQEKVQEEADGMVQEAAGSTEQGNGANKENGSTSAAGMTDTAGANGVSSGVGPIGETEAKAIVLKNAGLLEEDVIVTEFKKDLDDGVLLFEIDFFSKDGTEYNYELDAETGEILAYEFEAKKSGLRNTNSAMISEEQAKQVGLERVPGVKEEDIYLRIWEGHGKMEYKGYFLYSGVKYEYKVDAYSGEILKWEGKKEGY